MSESPEALSRAEKKAAPDDQFLRRVYGGDTGTGGPGGRANPATASRLEQDLEDKHDAAAMVRLRLKGGDDRGEGANGDKNKDRAITVVCAHLFYDPMRPDLKTAQCQMLFQAIQRFHHKCGVAPVLGSQAGGVQPSLGVANLILCADFNSKPVADPSFLPGPLKVSATTGYLLTSRNVVPPFSVRKLALRTPAGVPLYVQFVALLGCFCTTCANLCVPEPR